MLIDANLLLYAVDTQSPHHHAASTWLTAVLNGDRRVALPWQSIGAFVRIATHPKIMREPLTADGAAAYVDSWLACPVVWVPPTSSNTARIFTEILRQSGATGNLVPDAQLAALAIEHGLIVMSADTDFARFPDVRWENPTRH